MIFQSFMKVVRFLAERGFGLHRIPLVMRLYKFLYQVLSPQEKTALVIVEGHRMYVDVADKDMAALVSGGMFDTQMTNVFRKLVTKGMVCLDIGANVGYFTLIAANLVGEGGKVFAFEPEPYNFSLLARNVRVNGYHNVTLEQKAISAENGKAMMFVDRICPLGHFLITPNPNTHITGQSILEVKTQTIDNYFKDYTNKVDFVKIDVEGAELAVFEGMKNTIARNRNIIIITEFLPHGLIRFGASPEEFLRKVVSYGFHLYDIDEYSKAITPVENDFLLKKYPDGKHTNLLAVR